MEKSEFVLMVVLIILAFLIGEHSGSEKASITYTGCWEASWYLECLEEEEALIKTLYKNIESCHERNGELRYAYEECQRNWKTLSDIDIRVTVYNGSYYNDSYMHTGGWSYV